MQRWWERWGRRIFVGIGVIVFLGALGWVLYRWWIFPTWQDFANPALDVKDRLQQRTGVFQALAQIVGGVLVLLSVFVAWNTLRVNRQGQITDRFAKAIDHLGAKIGDGADAQPLLESRLGAIYALDRIARDSRRDYWSIMQVLTAYIRLNAAWAQPVQKEQWPVLGPPGIVAADIQAILTALTDRSHYDHPHEMSPLSLNRANLKYGDLHGVDLPGGDLRSCWLDWVNFERANLHQARLEDNWLKGTYFKSARLSGAHLDNTDARGANFCDADLRGADLWHADLRDANLRNADLRRGARASVSGTYAEPARLEEADLRGADLRDAKLQDADLRRVDLRNAARDLVRGANLQGARLDGADLRGADLAEVRGLTRQQYDVAVTGRDDATGRVTNPPSAYRGNP